MGDSDITVIVDDRGILLLGDEQQVDALVAAEGLVARALNHRTMAFAVRALQRAGEMAANSGRWVKLTPESAALVRTFGPSFSKADGLMYGVVRADKGRIARHLKFEKGMLNPSRLVTWQAALAQFALEQAIAEVTEYLKAIDKKLDQVLQDQKDQALADLIGISLSIDEAMFIRASVGGVSTTTWSKVQATATGLVRAQALALLKLEGITEAIERAGTDVGRIDTAAAEAKRDVKMWLGVLAKAVQLQDKLAVLELERVLQDKPDEVSLHLEGLKHARADRLDRVAQVVDSLTDRLRIAAEKASGQEFISPFGVTRVILSTNDVSKQVLDFEDHLGLHAPDFGDLTDPDWGESALKLLGDTAENAKAFGQGAINGVLGLGGRLAEARDKFFLDQAAAVAQRRSVEREMIPLNPGESLRGDTLTSGTTLSQGERFVSANGRYSFVYQDDGNLVLYDGSAALWASGTDGSNTAGGSGRCILQDDGNLVVYRADGTPAWASDTSGHPGSKMVVQDDGNVVIYEADEAAIWATDTYLR